MTIIWALILFVIIYLAVRLAIQPLLGKTQEEPNSGLIKLRDMDILSNTELEEVIELYSKNDVKKQNNEQYQKFANILNELKEAGYFTSEDYSYRMDRLNEYFKIN